MNLAITRQHSRSLLHLSTASPCSFRNDQLAARRWNATPKEALSCHSFLDVASQV